MIRPLACWTLCLAVGGCLSAGDPPRSAAPHSSLEASILECGEPCRIGVDVGPEQAREPMLSVNPRDSDHIVAAYQLVTAAGRTRDVSAVTWDGGLTWERGSPPRMGTSPAPVGDQGSFESDPMALVLEDGKVLYAALVGRNDRSFTLPDGQYGNAMTSLDLYVFRSSDGGKSFPEVVFHAPGRGPYAYTNQAFLVGTPDLQDKAWIAARGQIVLLVWVHQWSFGLVSELLWSVSKDGGSTWTAPAPLHAPRPEGASQHGPAPLITADGTWHVAFVMTNNRFPIDRTTDFACCLHLMLASSSDQGARWTVRTLLENGPFQEPQLDTGPGPSGGARLFLAHAEAVPGTSAPPLGSTSDIRPILLWSDDGGASWTKPLPLDGATALDGNSTVPALAVGADGTAYVSYYNQTSQHTCGVSRAEVCMERKVVAVRDGHLVSRVVLDAGFPGPVDDLPAAAGDYMGLVATRDGAYAAWIASHGQGPDLWGARVVWSCAAGSGAGPPDSRCGRTAPMP